MEGSRFYQMIRAEAYDGGYAGGFANGRDIAARGILILVGSRQFGPPDPATIAAIGRIERLEAMIYGLSEVRGWDEVLASHPDGE